jgi:hypothetical protein
LAQIQIQGLLLSTLMQFKGGKFMPEEQPLQPPQHQDEQPGRESEMTPRPKADDPQYRGSGKLQGKVALITGGDSGIGVQ